MSTNQILLEALTPILPTFPDVNADEDIKEYLIFSYDVTAVSYGDDTPQERILAVRVDYFAPTKKNTLATREAITAALWALDGTYPYVSNDGDKLGQHYVFDFEMLEDADA